MELGVLGLDGFQFQGSENVAGSLSLDGETSKQKLVARSGGFKQEGSGFCGDDWRALKVSKTDGDFSPASTALLLQNSRNLPLKSTSTSATISVSSDPNMLSFSSNSETSTLPYFHQMAAAYTKNTGYYSGALNASNGLYLLSGVRGPFTPSQWLELEQQALIYRYITANEPIPSELLIPIKKALESAGLFGFNGATLKPTTWGWGPFHLGYANSTDPEPGRCRRTDGKKWRCSRDAVADQKYCERHKNRGRHRSRKHVEGQRNGHSGSGATKSPTTKPTMPSVVASSAAMNPLLNRMLVNRGNSGQGLQDSTTQLSFLSPSGPNITLNCSESSFSIPKNRNSCDEPVPSVFTDDRSSILWPGLQSQSDSTQLSMAISMGSVDFMSSTSSPTIDKPAPSPVGLSRELEMGLGVGSQSNRQASWIPTSWEAAMGGPLGEVLQSSGNVHCSEEDKKASALNLLPKGWDGMESYQLSSSSPTGVLQKSALVSLSNSSAGSSPRADNSKTIESGGSLSNDLLGSTSLPALD